MEVKRILVVDDDTMNLKRTKMILGKTYDVELVESGIEALEKMRREDFDLILLDIMLPACSGYDILPKCKDIPVIILTARDGVYDKVKGLNRGAEDYIVKPFDMLELIARVNVVLRRNAGNQKEIFQLGKLCVDLQSHKISLDGSEVLLTLKEYELLEYFIRNRNIALTRERLIEQVWGYDYEGDTRTVDVHVASIRRKLDLGKQLKTVYKLGYRLEVP